MDRQRIDKWLWHARVVRTRTSAAALVSEGHVRLNGQRVTQPGQSVRGADVLTITLDRTVRILRVTGFVERRGATAAGLWDDLSPPPAPPDTTAGAPVSREPGSGRPTKRDRRMTDRLHHGDF